MPVELLISAPASGKTETCLRRIRALLLEQPFAPVRVVLPDRLQTAAFRRRLAEAGGAMGVQVGTFGDLYGELLELAGRSVPVASTSMVHRLVRSALEEVSLAGGLQYYAGLRETPGFALSLREAFAELKRALVYPENLVEQAAANGPAQQEMARLYTAYQARLQALQWADPEGLSWLAVEALQTNPDLRVNLVLLVVDGFDSFTGAQRRALQLLSPRVGQIVITLEGEEPFQRMAHRRFGAAWQNLAENLPVTVRNLSARPFLPAPLQHVEAALFETGRGVVAPGENLKLIEARSPAEEAREALRWLKARIVRDQVPLAACALATPDPDRYHPYLRMASAEFGLPLRFTQGEALAQSPAAAALLNLLNLPLLNYPRRPLLDALRCPYFDLSSYGLDTHSADILDEVSRFGQVIQGRSQWEEVFERLAQASGPLEDELEENLQLPSLPHGARLASLRQALGCFFDRLEPPDASLRLTRTLTDWIRWLEDLLDDWRFDALGASERDQSAFENMRETLRALVLSETIAGPLRLDYTQFVTELQGALKGAGYEEPAPGGQPAALVLRMVEARGVRFQALAILGLSEGIFPTVERADPFLDETQRQGLGLESRLQREQAGLFYQAVTRANRFLLLTRPYLAEDGEKWEPSPYWKAVLALLPEHSEQTIRPDDPRSLEEAASPEEALFWAVRRRSLPSTFSDLLPRWEILRHAHAVLRARQAEAPAGPHEGFPEPLADRMQTQYGAGHTWSASRLEAYSACPQQFYIQNVLALEAKAPPELGLDAAQLGTLLHAILELAYATSPNPADPASVLAGLPDIARGVFERAPLELGFRPSLLWQAEQEQLLQALTKTVQALANEDSGAGWRPQAFELPFGRGGTAPLAIRVEGETILLHGVVDRVDVDPNGRLRIIDYKTGGSHLSKQDLILGRRLQLPLYALALRDALGMGEPAEGLYWTLLKGEAGSLKLSSFTNGAATGPQAAIDTALGHLTRIVQGIRQAQFPPIPPKGGCPSYCPARGWCWRFEEEY